MFGFINHKVKDLNEFVKCNLCLGYLIDATTVIECMHSFCKTCIMKHLEDFNTCPKCQCRLHETKPYLDVRTDKVLQSIVYQLFPSVFKSEMKNRREFHSNHSVKSLEICHLSPEKRGEVPVESYSGLEEDLISIELIMRQKLSSLTNSTETPPIYMLCPSILTIGHLDKFLTQKFQLTPDTKLCLFCVANDELDEKYSITDIMCTYQWNKQRPLSIYYSFIITTSTESAASTPTALSSNNHNVVYNLTNGVDEKNNLFFLSRNKSKLLPNGKTHFVKNHRLRSSLKSDNVLTNVSKSMKII